MQDLDAAVDLLWSSKYKGVIIQRQFDFLHHLNEQQLPLGQG